ncbi:4-hydroxy-tetrahydrodipicolinate reductase [Azorhizobium oxalatiphilum]|uniref:4-hydroxy-tetrahydrodipicolinate reductase n=1 Tax=Azorhizobium oxalatiphilum TaxID=980631 RepID=A0A917C896_9HYPH|nr:4-hydroxy-tetrahydrodipicolinate reductase [Azorhizobium oxalatiphilum]GGF76856.1 4-hydroxy-tetrahydrodipicolinate reductase [Azorhizobium oxalatiphilum]
MSDLRVVINGAGGRMGQELLRAVLKGDGLALAGALEHASSSHLGEDAGVLAGVKAVGIAVESDAATHLNGTDVVVDFSTPGASVRLAERLGETGTAMVIGTTGFSVAENAAIEAAARRTAIVKSGNMSLGVNVLAALTRRASAALGIEFDIEIMEMHHARKVDAPSGTALLLGEAAAEGRGIHLPDWTAKARDGVTGARRPGDIGFASLRGGSVVGEHAVIFAGPSERIELVHKAEDRRIFVNGALAAARWAVGKEPGLYSMADVLGIAD